MQSMTSDLPDTSADSGLDEGRFRTLLRRWNRHQDLRRDGADIATLARSAEVLAAAREALRSAPYGRGA